MTPAEPTPQTTAREPAQVDQSPTTAPTEADTAEHGTPARSDQSKRLDLVEEQLQAHTRPVQIGEVVLRKEVVTEMRTIEVPVRREELVVERRVVERRPADELEEPGMDELERSLAARFRSLQEGQTIRLPLIQEEVVIEKRPFVYEEVLIGKRLVEETEQVSGTVRREVLKVTRRGEIDVSHVRRSSEGAAPDSTSG